MQMKLAINKQFALAAFAVCSIAVTAHAQDSSSAQPAPPVKDDGTITTPSFDLPFSSFASPESRDALVRRLRTPRPTIANAEEMRKATNTAVQPQVDAYTAHYPYKSVKSKIGEVPVETFEPTAGIAPENKDRILISIHGGGGTHGGGGLFGILESIAIVGEGRIKVVAVDYRLQPEHTVQDGIDDVLTVYREVLKTYRPENIGIYGCSAGGRFTGMSTTAIIRQKLPVPGAIGIFCASIPGIRGGDSSQIWPRFGSVLRNLPPPQPVGTQPPQDPFGPTQDEMKKFPATLLLTGTRAPEMSAAAQSNLELRMLGVASELVLFDGMDHGFFLFGSNFPESQRANQLIARFFLDHLGARPGTKKKS
jgi:acetyl esterase/lipase